MVRVVSQLLHQVWQLWRWRWQQQALRAAGRGPGAACWEVSAHLVTKGVMEGGYTGGG